MPTNQMRVLPALEIDFYHSGKLIFATVENCFLQPWKLIFTTWKLIFTTAEINFYHHGN